MNISIITGATGGLGKEFVKLLIEEKNDEVWCIARNIEKLNELKKISTKIKVFSIDLSSEKAYDEIKNELEIKKPIINYLINNAGSGRMDPSTSFSQEYISSAIKTQCITLSVLCNICIQYMEKGSHIINMSSQASFNPVVYINLYAACKAFITSYSRALNFELKNKGISVTASCPGWINTELLENERNGQTIKFPAMASADKVAIKTFKDAKKCKDMSVYGTYVKYMQFLSKIFPHKMIMRIWTKSVKKYIKED